MIRQPRRRRGPLEAALERSLAALARDEERGKGDTWADLRRALRDAALAVDLARADALNGGSRHTLALAVRTFVDLRVSVLPPEAPRDDEFTRALADLMRAETGDAAQP
jgi:hypothetical protein